MPSRREILLDSVRKLLSLEGVTEQDIIKNLKDVGISEKEAQALIAEAKGEKPLEELEEKPSEKEKEQKQKEEKKAERFEWKKAKKTVAKPLVAEKIEEESGIQVEEKPIEERKEEIEEEASALAGVEFEAEEEEKTRKPIAFEKPVFEPEPQIDLSKLWEKGILTTVNSRLEEMKKLKKEINSVIEEKVEKAMDREASKIKVLFESQKNLFSSTINSKLESKANELLETINSRISEFKKLNDSIQQNLSKFEAQKQVTTDLLKSFNERIADLEVTKKRLISEMNSELIQSKSEIESFIQDSRKKIVEIDNRITKTLELESRIAEGMLKGAEQKIEEIVSGKIKGLEERVGRKVVELSEIERRIDLPSIEGRIAKLFKQLEIFAQFQKHFEQFQDRIAEFEKLKERLETVQRNAVIAEKAVKEFAEFKQGFESVKSSAEGLKQSIEDFNVFKQQFVKVIEKNIQTFNNSIKDFNTERQNLEKTINERVKLIDGKMKELDDFEQNFAKEMGITLEKLKEKPRAIKRKK